MFSFVCSHGVTRKFSWNLNPPKLFCSFQNKKLKISYNNAAPFFSVANNQIVMKTIEGVAIESFITKGGVQKFLLNRLVDFVIKWVGGVPLVH